MIISNNKTILLICWLYLPAGLSAAELNKDYATLLCPTGLNIPESPSVDTILETDDIFMTADSADLVEQGISTLTGHAEMTRNTQQAQADYVQYDSLKNVAELDGNVNYWDETFYLKSDDAYLTFDNGVGEFTNANYVLIDKRGHGFAERMVADIGTRTDMEQLEYTTCAPDDKFWTFTASHLSLDHEKNQGKARNAIIRIKKIPVFYSPYLSFPLSKERKSGFLSPSYGNTDRYGFEFRTPYYWNISPNMDATLTPRLLTDGGLMILGEYRYLFKRASGWINLEYLPSDKKRNGDHRNLLHFTHRQHFWDTGELSFIYNRVSDKFYFEDFGEQLSTTSTRSLERRANVMYRGKNWNFIARIQDYQTTDRSIAAISQPYKRLPQIIFDYNSPSAHNTFNYGLNMETVYFKRGNNGSHPDNVNGLRVHLRPYISHPIHTMAGYLNPKISLDYTQYNLDNTTLFSKSPNRVLPIVSLDSGLFFERQTTLFNIPLLQTLEPRLYYLYVPRDDQSDLPVFDTNLMDISFDLLFREDRFSGNDRQSDANQITFGLTSQLINQEVGRNLMDITLGQIIYFQDREVTLPDGMISEENNSALIAKINTRPSQSLNINSDIIWDPYSDRGTEKVTLNAVYNPMPGKILNFGYRVRRNTSDIEQSDISFHWSITKNWSVVGRWNYAIPEARSLELFGGIEYQSCCWGMRAVARRFLTDINGEFDTGIFLQIELKGLVGAGSGKTVDFLRQQIPGYRNEF